MPRTKEFVVPLENRPGTLGEVTRALAGANINILGIALETTRDFGIARFIVADPAKAESTLKSKGYKYRATDVITVRLPNTPGTLADVSEKLARSNINIEGVFGYTPTNANEGEIIFKVSDIAQAEKIIGG